uniref:Putative 1-aminocyclopropane-1-carboxylate synthase n=1 Tax=Davidia involucrata TaxID=16924 RepID=A0A5B6YXI2_DAVIN
MMTPPQIMYPPPLTAADYNKLCQCETLDDIKIHLSATEYRPYLQKCSLIRLYRLYIYIYILREGERRMWAHLGDHCDHQERFDWECSEIINEEIEWGLVLRSEPRCASPRQSTLHQIQNLCT